MSEKLNWVISDKNQTSENPIKLHQATCQQTDTGQLKLAVLESVDKAISLLSDNIIDESRYLLFEWAPRAAELKIVVTDDDKAVDSSQVVVCYLNGSKESSKLLDDSHIEEFTITVREWIHNHLTTSAGFMRFSLIAVFHNDTRKHCRLL